MNKEYDWRNFEKDKENAILVRCFGVDDDKVRNIGAEKPVQLWRKGKFVTEMTKTVEILNEKIGKGIWQNYPLVDYYDACPVCGKLMRVQAIRGTTWLACCSKDCYTTYVDEHPNMFFRDEQEESQDDK